MEEYDYSHSDAEREDMALLYRLYRLTQARHLSYSDATNEQERSSFRSSVPLLIQSANSPGSPATRDFAYLGNPSCPDSA
jgi:hypothetical protein